MKANYLISRMAGSICVLAIAGCAPSGFTPKLAPHEPSANALAQSTASAPQGTWPAPDWIRAFGDAQLDALVNRALQGNPDLQVAQARIRGADAQLQQFSSMTGLTATMNASFEKAHAPQSNGIASVVAGGQTIPVELGGASSTSPSSLFLGLNYDLDLWGKNRETSHALLAARDEARMEAEQVKLTLSVAIASLYCELDSTYTLASLLEKKRAASEQIVSVLRERQMRGIDNGYDASNAARQRAKLEELISINETRRQLLQLQLGTLSGQGPELGLTLHRPHLAALADPKVPAQLPLGLLGRRPDIVAAKLRVESAYATTESTRASFYPDINLSAIGGLFAMSPAAMWSHQALGGSAGPALSLPIFDRGRLKAKLAGDVANMDVTIATYSKTVDHALAQVAQKLTALRTSARLLTAQQESVSAAQRMVAIAEDRHRRGLAMEKDVNSARLTYLDEQMLLENLLDAKRLMHVGLIDALGGGFDANHLTDAGAPIAPFDFNLLSQSRLTASPTN